MRDKLTIIDKSWDSDMIGVKSCEIKLSYTNNSANYFSKLMDVLEKGNYGHAIIRVPVVEMDTIQALECLDFVMVDCYFRMYHDLYKISPVYTAGYSIREADIDDLQEISDLAEKSFVYDRFHYDPAITDHAANFIHLSWARNAVLGKYGDRVNVAECDIDGADVIIGFNTLRLDNGMGVIDLGAVSHKAIELNLGGVGRQLVRAALGYFVEQGCLGVYTGTQAANHPSINMHLHEGFIHTNTFITLAWSA